MNIWILHVVVCNKKKMEVYFDMHITYTCLQMTIGIPHLLVSLPGRESTVCNNMFSNEHMSSTF